MGDGEPASYLVVITTQHQDAAGVTRFDTDYHLYDVFPDVTEAELWMQVHERTVQRLGVDPNGYCVLFYRAVPNKRP